MTFTPLHCSVCEYDVPEFLWTDFEPGGHAVLIDGPVQIERDQDVDHFIRNTIRIRVTMDVRAMFCRDVPRRGLPTPEDLDRAHAAVMADADLLLGDPEAVRAKNRAALLDEQIRAGEILRANRPAPDTSWVTTRDVRDAYPRSGWLRGILPWTRRRR